MVVEEREEPRGVRAWDWGGERERGAERGENCVWVCVCTCFCVGEWELGTEGTSHPLWREKNV